MFMMFMNFVIDPKHFVRNSGAPGLQETLVRKVLMPLNFKHMADDKKTIRVLRAVGQPARITSVWEIWLFQMREFGEKKFQSLV